MSAAAPAARPGDARAAAAAAGQPPGQTPGPAAARRSGREPGGRPGPPSPQPEPDGSRFPADLADRVHMSLLAGLLSHIGMQDDRLEDPRQAAAADRSSPGARGARFAIFPDSALARKPPPWVVAAELVETSRLWARTVARIEPEWAEQLAGAPGPAQRTASRTGTRGAGAAMATEKVTLYGLPIVAARHGQLWPHRPGGGARAVHHARPGRGRLADPPPVLRSATSRLLAERRGPGTQGPQARHRRRRRARCSTSTTGGSRPR